MRPPNLLLLSVAALALSGCVFVHHDDRPDHPPPGYDHGPAGYDHGEHGYDHGPGPDYDHGPR